jgi:hypothetical protein
MGPKVVPPEHLALTAVVGCPVRTQPRKTINHGSMYCPAYGQEPDRVETPPPLDGEALAVAGDADFMILNLPY